MNSDNTPVFFFCFFFGMILGEVSQLISIENYFVCLFVYFFFKYYFVLNYLLHVEIIKQKYLCFSLEISSGSVIFRFSI